MTEQVTAGAKVGYETVADAVDKLVKFAKPAVETAAPVVSVSHSERPQCVQAFAGGSEDRIFHKRLPNPCLVTSSGSGL